MTRYDLTIALATVAFLVGLAIIASGPSGGFVQFLTHPATAAWMQAVGSVGAIAVAVWADRGSARRAIEKETRDKVGEIADWEKCLSDVARLAENARRLTEEANALTDPDHPRRLINNAVMMVQVYLRQMPPTPKLAFAMSSVQSHLQLAKTELDADFELSRMPSVRGGAHAAVAQRLRAATALKLAAQRVNQVALEYWHDLW